MNKYGHSPSDFLLSLVIPGWTQLLYFAPFSACYFFFVAVYIWIDRPYPIPLLVHLLAGIHGLMLVAEHFSGKRLAVPFNERPKKRTVMMYIKEPSALSFHPKVH